MAMIERIINGHQVIWDGSCVWVNSSDGAALGRFGKRGLDVHTTPQQQRTGAGQCLACTHSKPTWSDWVEFQAKMLEHYNVQVVDEMSPTWLKHESSK